MRRSALASLFALFFATLASAGLTEQIRANHDPTAVIIPVPFQDSSEGYGIQTMPLSDFIRVLELKSPGILENDYFKVVEGEGSDALSLADFDARNVLYHLMIARAYYARLAANSGREDPALEASAAGPILVRIGMDRQYNLASHFAELPEHNNEGYFPRSFNGAWNREIWFDSRKGGFERMNWYRVFVNSGFEIISKDWPALAAVEPFELSREYNRGMEGTRMPDAIYHEAFHWAADAPGLRPAVSKGNPVDEDYANYFGASLLGRPVMAEIGEFSSSYYRRRFDRIRSIRDSNPSTYNSETFGPSVFWEIRRELGPERADQLLWNSIPCLKGTYKETRVPGAVLEAAQNDGNLSAAEVSALAALFGRYQESYANLERKEGVYAGLPVAKTDQERLVELVKNVDDAKLRKSSRELVEKVRGLAEELRGRGVPIPADVEARIQALSQSLAKQSRSPGFRDAVLSAVSRVGHGFERAGIDALEGMDELGSATYSITAAPLTFGSDFAVGAAVGRPFNPGGRERVRDDLVAGSGGIAAFYFAYTGLEAAGIPFLEPISMSTLGVVVASAFVCANQKPDGGSERARFCARNAKLMQVINLNTAKAGTRTGTGLHRALARVAREIKDYLSFDEHSKSMK